MVAGPHQRNRTWGGGDLDGKKRQSIRDDRSIRQQGGGRSLAEQDNHRARRIWNQQFQDHSPFGSDG